MEQYLLFGDGTISIHQTMAWSDVSIVCLLPILGRGYQTVC